MTNKTQGFKDARENEGMNSVTFYPETPVFGKNDIDTLPEEHRQACVLVTFPTGPSERVLTETEVRDIAQKMNRILAFGRTESSNRAVREILALHGITL